jgi:nucleoside-diphosphate-sugar epimerase
MTIKILVTGGAGYVGTTLVPMLLGKGYHVTVFDNLMYEQCVLLDCFTNKSFRFVKKDIRDYESLKNEVDATDLIIHLASIVGAPACQLDPLGANSVNYEGTVNINKARGSKPIIFPSTTSLYGVLEEICTEKCKVNPLSIYSKTKYQAEQNVIESGNCVVYRPATAFGVSPRMRLDLMVNDFAYKAVKTNNLVVYEGNAKRTFVHVRDFARSVLHAIDNFEKMEGEIYNLGSESLNFTKREIAEKIRDIHDYYLHFAEFGADPDRRDYAVSYEKLRSTGFNTEIDIEQGIKELVLAYEMIHIHTMYSNYIK